MKIRVCVLALLCLCAGAALVLLSAARPGAKTPPAKPPAKTGGPDAMDVSALRITGPYIHENLSVFLLHGKDRIEGRKFLSLAEALERKTLLIEETGSVRELRVTNTGDLPVYIQSGEVIKGGKQDRMLQYDYVIAPHSEKQPLAGFCVESGRWSRRGTESATVFAASTALACNAIVSSNLVRAGEGDQGAVWREVAVSQEKLSLNVGSPVQATTSPSSLQLTLEDERLQAKAEPYRKALADVLAGQRDVIGVATAINGQVTTVDVYACRALLEKLWPKLLETGAVEAIAELDGKAALPAPTAQDVRDFVAEVEKARARERQVAEELRMQLRETGRASMHVTLDAGEEVHRGYHKKEEGEKTEKPE